MVRFQVRKIVYEEQEFDPAEVMTLGCGGQAGAYGGCGYFGHYTGQADGVDRSGAFASVQAPPLCAAL